MKDIERDRLIAVGRRLAQHRANAEAMREIARKTALRVLEAGASESEVARLLGIDRMTVRKWRGKR